MAPFKVMTWNVKNLFKPVPGSAPPTQADYNDKLDGLAAKIKAQGTGSHRSKPWSGVHVNEGAPI